MQIKPSGAIAAGVVGTAAVGAIGGELTHAFFPGPKAGGYITPKEAAVEQTSIGVLLAATATGISAFFGVLKHVPLNQSEVRTASAAANIAGAALVTSFVLGTGSALTMIPALNQGAVAPS